MDEKPVRRTVSMITKYLEPKKIFNLIIAKSWPYIESNLKPYYVSRDRAFMAMAFCSAGRVTAILGGPRRIVYNKCLKCEGEVQKIRLGDSHRWICTQCEADYGTVKPRALAEPRAIGIHPGIRRKNLKISSDSITITDMRVVKRSQKVIKKHGIGATIRDDFVLPLKNGIFKSEYGDQLVPFTWLLKEYIDRFSPKERLFPFCRARGWDIVATVTEWFPNWFRAQAEHFYGNYLIQDSVKLSKFVKVVNPNQVAHYIGFSYESLLKDTQRHMDFNWIDPAIEQIKKRIENSA